MAHHGLDMAAENKMKVTSYNPLYIHLLVGRRFLELTNRLFDVVSGPTETYTGLLAPVSVPCQANGTREL